MIIILCYFAYFIPFKINEYMYVGFCIKLSFERKRLWDWGKQEKWNYFTLTQERTMNKKCGISETCEKNESDFVSMHNGPMSRIFGTDETMSVMACCWQRILLHQYYASSLLFIFLLLDLTFSLSLFSSIESFIRSLIFYHWNTFVCLLRVRKLCIDVQGNREKDKTWNKYHWSKYAHIASWWQKTHATWIQIDSYHTPCNIRRDKEREKKNNVYFIFSLISPIRT